MSHDEDPLDLLEDDGDGVIEMCLFFDKESEKDNPKGPPQKAGCGFVLLLMGASVITSGFLLGKFMS
jgi:hypothetical protein